MYIDAFRESDHPKILSCLSDDVWYMPAMISLSCKEALDKEIENDFFLGKPSIQIKRMVEENNIVIAEGPLQCKIKAGGMLDALFYDEFEMENGKW